MSAGRWERFYGWLAGKLIVRAARLAFRRGDLHEFAHLAAAIRVGNTGPGSHTRGCLFPWSRRDHGNRFSPGDAQHP